MFFSAGGNFTGSEIQGMKARKLKWLAERSEVPFKISASLYITALPPKYIVSFR